MKNKIKLSVRNAAVIMCILAVAEMGASCKKDPCKNTVCPSGTVATESEDGKKCTCEPVVNIETEIVKVGSIEDVKNLKTTVTDLVQNNQHLKNVLISGTGAFVTAPDQFGIWRAFGGLEAEFPNLSLTFEQNGQVVCPRDNNTPLSHAEWKQWWFSADVPLLLGVNPWSGNRWLIAAGELQLFIDDGCDPFSINKEMKDTVDINIGDNVNPDPVQWWLTNSNSTKQTIEIGRQGGKTFYRVYLNSNINISLQDKNTAADIINFGKQYSDTLVKVFYEGKKLSPKVSGIPIDFQYWTGTLNKFPLDANAGVKFTIFCKEEDSWKGEGYNTATTFDIDQTDCTGNDTIKINNETALNAAPAQIAQSIAKPLTKTYVWVNGNFSVHNGTAWETSAAQVFDYIDNQQVTWIAPAGKISAGSDSVRVNDMEILKGLGDKNLLEPNSYAGNNFFYHAGFTGNTLSLIPQGQIMRTDILQSSEGGDVSNPVPSVYEINTQGGANAMGFVTLYDAGWKYDIALQITASDAYFMRVNDKFLNMLESPAGPAVSTAPFRLVSAVNPILALYSANSGSTAVNGLNNTTYEVDGGNYSGNKLLASLRKARAANGSTVYPVRVSTNSNVTSTFYTNDPNVVEDSSGRFYFDWEDVLEHRDANNGKFVFSNAVTYSTDMTVLNNYLNKVLIPGLPASNFYGTYDIITTTDNVEMTNVLPNGKQTYQMADPGSLQLSAKSSAPRSKTYKIPVKKYKNRVL